jgi:hypothetical protein
MGPINSRRNDVDETFLLSSLARNQCGVNSIGRGVQTRTPMRTPTKANF